MRRTHGLRTAGIAALSLFVGAMPSGVRAGEVTIDTPTFEERRLERGIELRERSRARAGAQLGYPVVLPSDAVRGIDYFTVSQQIARLAALLQMLGNSPGAAAAGGFLPTPPGWAGPEGPSGSVAAVYGPEGPTERSVRLLLEYRLMVAGNPRLKVGEIRESEDRVTARIVTADGSLVDEYVVDKETGVWTPVR